MKVLVVQAQPADREHLVRIVQDNDIRPQFAASRDAASDRILLSNHIVHAVLHRITAPATMTAKLPLIAAFEK